MGAKPEFDKDTQTEPTPQATYQALVARFETLLISTAQVRAPVLLP